ncbi:MAG: cache domain-containing protein, partial [Spirochaetaceae bacterium]|nr:cache domain-containing protein [Spirochaetaceae bacterium]
MHGTLFSLKKTRFLLPALFLYTLLPALTAAILGSVLIFNRTSGILKKELKEQTLLEADIISDAFQRQHMAMLDISSVPEVRRFVTMYPYQENEYDLIRTTVLDTIGKFRRSSAHIRAVTLMNRDYTIIASNDEKSIGMERKPADRQNAWGCMLGEAYIVSAQTCLPVTGGNRGIYCADYTVPIYSENDEFIGCFQSSFYSSLFTEVIEETGSGTGRILAVYSNSGSLLSGRMTSETGTVNHPAVFRGGREDQGYISYTGNGGEYLGYYVKNSDTGWTVLRAFPVREMEKASGIFLSGIILFLILSAVTGGIFYFFVVQNITAPALATLGSTKEVKQGIYMYREAAADTNPMEIHGFAAALK